MTDLRVKRGDTITAHIGPMRKADGTILNITGHTAKLTAKDRLEDLDAAAIISATQVIADGTAGTGTIVVPKTATQGFTTDRVLHWDVQLTDPGGATITVDEGKLYVTRDVTRA